MASRTEAAYLDELGARAACALRSELVGAYAGGSWALGDYLPARSDLDVAIVAEAPPRDETLNDLIGALRHESLPCPARGLELVVYTRAVAGAGEAAPAFELNLNTGARMADKVERHGGTTEAHWYAIDRAILAEHGVALTGPPAPEVFKSPPRALVLGLLAQSLRWHGSCDAAPDDVVEGLDFRTLSMRGQVAKRTVRHFGLDYDYESTDLVEGDPLPAELEWVRERCAALIERDPEDLVQILISRYPEGAGIGWHRDAPMFGSKIVGLSLAAPCRMRFQRTVKGERETAAVELQPRSVYVLAGKARWSWQHSIPGAKALRYSITFRTLKRER